MPRAARRCNKGGCEELVPCPDHPRRDYRAERDRTGSRHERGYDSEHVKRAAALRSKGKRDDLPCDLCGLPIDYSLRTPHPLSFAAHHLTGDKRGPIAPAHKLCNERAGDPTGC